MSIYPNFFDITSPIPVKGNGAISEFDSTLLDSCEIILYYLDINV